MNCNSQDPRLQAVANTGLAVVSIGYRLAPEHPFPKGPEDCYDAAEWFVDNSQAKFGVPLKFAGGEVGPDSYFKGEFVLILSSLPAAIFLRSWPFIF